ncbi:PH domain-containing protein [Corynebacterium sp. ES2794-CONJ1]|uniref:PH domain-containing protein n=1 Tax=unclassified Corynebacterium TaxID=2624378 RepID=UPI002167D649|nr:MULTISPECIES: PH domain-containing protein [unclassified Corynebacterium]MCS4489279.1 PH domain-containing protein [Corynebacterium sp. ES2775-CONJ]MCS4491092.1 PH domain-containing protein [Corynebacterium sp. ES2715-CONJ3]MCS4531027.1 PH domain-containing protein [Corynebacterium sp. ES2730-CONJ]MCU9518394.1 PH domain-containing protein [Corynebacterium sp. ES2794-CONJ1]
MNERTLQNYVAADAALTTTKPWMLDISSGKMRLYAIVFSLITVALHTFLAFIVAVGDTGAAVTLIDQIGYFLVGCVFATVIYIALSRPRLRANEDGVEVRNFIGTQFYPWAVIYGLDIPQRAWMARLELPDFEYVPIWAILKADGLRSVDAVEKFRALEAKFMPED